MNLRPALVATLLVAIAVMSCKPSDPCDGPSSFDVTTKVTGSFSLSAKSTWAVKSDESSFEIFAADYDQDPHDLRKQVPGTEGSLVRIKVWDAEYKPIAAGAVHTFNGPKLTFTADVTQKKPPDISLYGVVFNDPTVKGTLTVKSVTDTKVCGEVDVSDGFVTIKGLFVAPFVPKK